VRIIVEPLFRLDEVLRLFLTKKTKSSAPLRTAPRRILPFFDKKDVRVAVSSAPLRGGRSPGTRQSRSGADGWMTLSPVRTSALHISTPAFVSVKQVQRLLTKSTQKSGKVVSRQRSSLLRHSRTAPLRRDFVPAEDFVLAEDSASAWTKSRLSTMSTQTASLPGLCPGRWCHFLRKGGGLCFHPSAPLRLCRLPGLRPPRSGAEDTATRTSFLSKKGGGLCHLRPSTKWRSGEVEKRKSGEAEKWRSGVVHWTSASLPGRSHLLRKGKWCHLRPSVHPSIRPRRGEVEKR
jgi:hypothetical protein